MIKLESGKGFRIMRGAKPDSRGQAIAELKTAPGYSVEFEIKIYDANGLLFHVGREGIPDHYGREDFGFLIVPDVDISDASKKLGD